jgi:hypothetical protein
LDRRYAGPAPRSRTLKDTHRWLKRLARVRARPDSTGSAAAVASTVYRKRRNDGRQPLSYREPCRGSDRGGLHGAAPPEGNAAQHLHRMVRAVCALHARPDADHRGRAKLTAAARRVQIQPRVDRNVLKPLAAYHLTRVEMNPAPCARLSACAALGGVVDTFEHR